MPKYRVQSPLKHNGADFKEGDIVEMSAKDAKELIASKVLAEDKTEEKKENKKG